MRETVKLPYGAMFDAYVRYKAGDFGDIEEYARLKEAVFSIEYGSVNYDTSEADALARELEDKLASGCNCDACRWLG